MIEPAPEQRQELNRRKSWTPAAVREPLGEESFP
jgi:hypothetical protein